MAGHIQDRWYKTEKTPDGKTRRVRTSRYGKGMRYRARYVGPDGTEKSKSFPNGQKRLAEQWLNQIEVDMTRGTYLDPKAARITFQQYGKQWLADLTTDITSRDSAERVLRLHAFPYLGSRPMPSFRPGHIREWARQLENSVPATSHRRIIFGYVSAVFRAAVDDGLLAKNPCRAKSVRTPAPSKSRIKPWAPAQVFAVRAGLPDRFRAVVDVGAGCGLRQGEIFGLPEDALDYENGWLAVRQQLKRVRGKYVFAPPKGRKFRDVPLPAAVAAAIRVHSEKYPPVEVTLPWGTPDGPLVTKALIFTGRSGDHVRVSYFNDFMWKPALATACIIPPAANKSRYQSAPEDGMHALRHFYASVLLDAGENIKALSLYLGHSDPGFTLRTYTHLMPSSEGRTRKAVESMYQAMQEG